MLYVFQSLSEVCDIVSLSHFLRLTPGTYEAKQKAWVHKEINGIVGEGNSQLKRKLSILKKRTNHKSFKNVIFKHSKFRRYNSTDE